jgi:hypothetical protein
MEPIMPIHDLVYRRMPEHPPRSPLRAVLAIGRSCSRQAMRGWFPKVWLILCMLPGAVGFVAVWFATRQEDSVLALLTRTTGESYGSFAEVPAALWYRLGSNFVHLGLILVQGWLATVATAVFGAGQLADDLRTRAFEIYLARPIAAAEYMLGKLLAIVRPLVLILAAPTLFTLATAHVLIPASLQGTLVLYPVVLAAALVYAGLNALVILGISSLGRSARYATVVWFALYFLGMVVAEILQRTTGDGHWHLLSYRANLQVVLDHVLDLEPLVGLSSDPAGGPAEIGPSLAVLAGLGAASVLLVRRRLRAGRLP